MGFRNPDAVAFPGTLADSWTSKHGSHIPIQNIACMQQLNPLHHNTRPNHRGSLPVKIICGRTSPVPTLVPRACVGDLEGDPGSLALDQRSSSHLQNEPGVCAMQVSGTQVHGSSQVAFPLTQVFIGRKWSVQALLYRVQACNPDNHCAKYPSSAVTAILSSWVHDQVPKM